MGRKAHSRAASVHEDDDLAAYFARPDLALRPTLPLPPGAEDASQGMLRDATFDLPHRGNKKRASSLSRLVGRVGGDIRYELTGVQRRRSSASRSHSRARSGGGEVSDDSPSRAGSPAEAFDSNGLLDSPQDSMPYGLFSREARRQSRERQQHQQAAPSTSSVLRQRADSAPTFPHPSLPNGQVDSGEPRSGRRGSTRIVRDGSDSEAAGVVDLLRVRDGSVAAPTSEQGPLQSSATQTGPHAFNGSSFRHSTFSPTTTTFTDPLESNPALGPPPQQPLFKATFSPRQLARLERASKHVERHDRKLANEGMVGAEIKVALGLFDVLNKEKKEQKRAHGQVKGRTAANGDDRSHGPAALAGLAHQLEEQFEHRLGGVEHDLHESEHRFEAHVDRASVAKGVGGAAALVGLVGAGYEMWQHEKKRREEEHGQAGRGAGPARSDSLTKEARGSAQSIADDRRSSAELPRGHEFAPPHLPASLTPRPVPPHSTTPYLSSLTPAQHHLVQHAAAALLLKDHAHGHLHEKMHRAVGGFEKMVKVLEVGMEKAWIGVSGHVAAAESSGGGGGRRPSKLFGTPLPVVTHHEGVDSFHGADPHGTVRIPEFIDHCITALMQADVTVEGILRKNGKLRLVREIMEALDSNGGNDAVIDLAALDPVTLADLFKRFLAALPDPVLTSHLFKLFVACSHIHNVNMRRRCMHLVLCLMPKVNRDVLEVVFLFLEWLSQFAHITVKDGNQMNLTAIATVMAPTLLRPTHRDPKPTEINAMIAAILSLLEDQHFLHTVPLELAQVLHLHAPPRKKDVEGKKRGLEGGAALLHALAKVI